MSELRSLLAFHAKNPITNLLQLYKDMFQIFPYNEAISMFFSGLSQYTSKETSDQDMLRLSQYFSKASKCLREESLQMEPFAKVSSAIWQDLNEQCILELSYNALEVGVKGMGSLGPTKSKTTFRVNYSEMPSFDRTAQDLENFMKADLDNNVFFEIPTFCQAFFIGKDWSKQTSHIWKSYQMYEVTEIELRSSELQGLTEPKEICEQEKMHKAKTEKILKKHMDESEVWDWLNFFRQTFLNQFNGPSPNPSQEHPVVIEMPYIQIKGQYCRTGRTRRAQRPNSRTQVDFLVKSITLPNDGSADWEKINVLGEFTVSPGENQRKPKFLQLSRSVREVFCAQPLRRYIHGFCMFEEQFELWLFDRSGAYSTGLKSIVEDKEMFVRALCSYVFMSNEELGCDMSVLQNGEDKFVQFPKIGKTPGPLFEIKSTPMLQSTRVVTRGTTCFETKDESTVIKYSWTNSEKNTEMDFLEAAKAVPGVVNCISSEVIYETKSHLDGLFISRAVPWNLKASGKVIAEGIVTKKSQLPSRKRNRRLTRIALTPRGRDIYSSGSILEFVAGIRDAIKGHEGLVGKEILHGDISEGNIILLKPSPGNDLYGMLIDLDHSVKMKGNLALEESLSLTGTMKFMALERLEYAEQNESIVRTCRHDLESFFYVFIVGCIEYESVLPKDAHDLNYWCASTVQLNFKSKRDDVQNFEKCILNKFTDSFEGLKDLAKRLRKILFNDDGRYVETPNDCGPMYRRIIMAMDETIDEIKAGRIENKTFEARRK